MKKSILSLLVLAFAAMTSTAMAQEIRQGAVIEFEKDVHDYGEIDYAGDGTYSFKFSNTGTEPLLISKAKGSCGCTVPSWPKDPIAPGASAEIKVTYDTKRPGAISKSVTITSNAVNTPVKVIRIKGRVLPAPPPPPVEEVEAVEAVEDAVEEAPVEVVEEAIPLTKKQIRAKKKAEKKRLRAEKKARKKAAKLALKKEKEAKKAEA